MVLELAAITGALAVCAALGRAYRQRPRAPEPPRDEAEKLPLGALKLGDVLLYLDDELWLAGSVSLTDGSLRLRLFSVPAARSATWLGELDGHSGDLALLREESDVPAGALPDVVSLGGRVLTLRDRTNVHIACAGEHLPTFAGRYLCTRFEAAGGRVLLVLDAADGTRLALGGERMPRALFEVLPGGSAG